MFCENLKKLRKQHQMTQSDVAIKLNISRVAYTNYELGNREPDFETLKRISKIFETSIDYLLDNDYSELTLKELRERLKNLNELPNYLLKTFCAVLKLNEQSCKELIPFIETLRLRESE